MRYLLNIFILILFWSCQYPNSNEYQAKSESTNAILQDTHPGKILMETHCNICHSPTASEKERLAPPMIAIKRHYIGASTTKTDFVRSLNDWIQDPKEENAKMFGAVNRFGVMVKMPFSEETINQIGDYMYDYEIEQPSWFEDHFNNQRGKRKNNKF
ncbi:MAG: hypothetical protein EX263_13640 [Flavobacteriaceae bacterium]|nr:hypothetical protein [Flavobacteriaceae bacterium]RZW39373.1 MAG: hypothetical protein EX263_13640 [Flavobacteriaceae bacterium]